MALEYYVNGKKQTCAPTTMSALQNRYATATAGFAPSAAAAATLPAVNAAMTALQQSTDGLASRFHFIAESHTLAQPDKRTGALTIFTQTLAAEGLRRADRAWLKNTHGFEQIDEGRHKKELFIAPQGGRDGVETAFEVAAALHRTRGATAYPNFIRSIARPHHSTAAATTQWNLDNDGAVGIIGSDVHAQAAWTITAGSSDIRIAVLDEGVDSDHPALSAVIAGEYDAVDGNSHARPDGNDAHGTACAGIIGSQDGTVWGLATDCLLLGVRIAKSDASGHWIFDDYATADAIDWAWDDGEAAVLSNSWGGGLPSDAISRAVERARNDGRNGLGTVCVFAAGNNQGPILFPGTLEGVLTVGASNQWDERKTKTSNDGEDFWGSNAGDELDLMAPGVEIRTTDISGRSGYTRSDFVGTFNGTSSATPHAAAAAGMVLAVRPDLTEAQVRNILRDSCDPMAGGERFVGKGRLNTYAALRAARRI